MDITFHYPPELMNLLVDTIPLLCRSKADTLLFLRGAGVAEAMLSDLKAKLQQDRNQITKYEITRTVLTQLNEQGESALRERREVLRRIVDFADFSSCWESDRLRAQGLVANVRQIVNVKDTFTRIKQERDVERQQRIADSEVRAAAAVRHRAEHDAIKADLYSLFRESNPRKRGKALESILNRMFAHHELLIREAFALTGTDGEGVVEQIDGVIELDGHLYLVEVKWWEKPVGRAEVSQHLVRVFTRAESRAIVVSASAFTEPAIAVCREALSQKVVVLMTLEEFVRILDREHSLKDALREKVYAAISDKNPFTAVSL